MLSYSCDSLGLGKIGLSSRGFQERDQQGLGRLGGGQHRGEEARWHRLAWQHGGRTMAQVQFGQHEQWHSSNVSSEDVIR